MSGSKSGSVSRKAVVVAGLAVPAVVLLPVVLLLAFVLVVATVVQSQYGQSCSMASGSAASWVAWAKSIADDDSHGYSQPHRTGDPDYDCSSLVYYALRNAGLDVGPAPFNTRSEDAALTHAGFERHAYTSVADLQTGDIVWKATHTEIYAGDGMFVGAHYDERHGVRGEKPGDQTGHEISVSSYASGYTYYYRYAGAGNVVSAVGSSSGQAVSGSTGATRVTGMSERDAMAWYGGAQGPDNACIAYAYGQCTWWACMRGNRLGWKRIGSYWGNGQDWASSASKAGYRTTRDAPVPGALLSIPAGVLGSSPVYGHVAVVEAVDTAKGTVTTSEKGAGVRVYSRTLPIVNGGTYILPSEALSGMAGADAGSVTDGAAVTGQCVAGGTSAASSADPSGVGASAEDAKRIARRKVKELGWDDAQYGCLVNLWNGESGWDLKATNPSSGAYGIPQALPGSKMASAGQDWRTNAATQIDWGLNYIRQRYGTPCGAWGVWQSRSPHWY